MQPSRDQIEVAAYHRWQRRWQAHGHDQHDWVAAEKDLTFALNYQFLARYRLDAPARQPIGAITPRRCRFCERAEPQTTFEREAPTVPVELGNVSLVSLDDCDECHDQFVESLQGDLLKFAGPLLALKDVGDRVIGADYTWVGQAPDSGNGRPELGPPLAPAEDNTPGVRELAIPSEPYVPVAAFKGLVRMGLALLPETELHHFEDAVEWVSNPDHALDARLFGTIGCHAYLAPNSFPEPWAGLARRVVEDEPYPYMLFFLGTGRVAFQVYLPLSNRDEDLEDEMILPTVSLSGGEGHAYGASQCLFIPLSSAETRKHARLDLDLYRHPH